jgi:cephalosporin hydroxylase
MIPLFEYEGKAWFPLGLTMSQNRLAIPAWSYSFEKYPPKRIIEIGTNSGGFTIALGIHAWRIGATIYTFDVCKAPTEAFLPLSRILPIMFYKTDCFMPDITTFIKQLIELPGICYVLCDGGDKPKEFNLFADFLKPGDVIAAHDYSVKEEWWPWSEITCQQVATSVFQNKLVAFMQEHFDMAGWLAFRKE